jgi:hypothetical protein
VGSGGFSVALRRPARIAVAVSLAVAGLALPVAPARVAAAPGTAVCGAVTAPQTWTAAGSPYLICPDGMTVNGTTLTLDGGGGPITIQAQGAHGGFNVFNGGLVTTNTGPSATVSFDGPSAAPGSWPGIRIREYQPPAGLSLNAAYLTVEHAVTGVIVDIALETTSLTATFDHLGVGDASLDGVSGANGAVTLTHASVHDTGRDGVSGNDDFTLTDSTIDHAARIGVLNGAPLLGSTVLQCKRPSTAPFRIARDIVTNSGNLSPGYPAMFTDDASALMPSGGGGANQGGGNWNDAIAINGCVSTPITWASPTQSSSVHTLGYEIVVMGLTARLTVPAGAVVKGSRTGYLGGVVTYVAPAAIQVMDSGVLDGTAGGAIFTSLSDNATGAALCPSILVPACTPAPGDFGGIHVTSGLGAEVLLTGATVEYADVAVADTANVLESRPDAVLDNTTIQHVDTGLAASAMSMSGGSIGDAHSFGVYSGGGHVSLSGVTIHDVGGDGVFVQGGDTQSGTVSLTGNVLQRVHGTGIWIDGKTHPVVTGNTVTGDSGLPIAIGGVLSVGPGQEIDGNVGSGNAADAMEIAGTLTSSLTWVTPQVNSPGQPLGYIGGNLTMDGPLSFVVPANAVVKSGALRLKGAALDAHAGGATFALPGDDSVGVPLARLVGTTTYPGISTTAGITLSPSSDGTSKGSAAIHNAQLREGWTVALDSGAVAGPAGASTGLSVDGSAIQASVPPLGFTGYGVGVFSGTAMLSCDRVENNHGGVAVMVPGTSISESNLDGNAAGGTNPVYDLDNVGGVAVSARQNWWGQASGPAPGQVSNPATADTLLPLSAPSSCAPPSVPRTASSLLSSSTLSFGRWAVGHPLTLSLLAISNGSAPDTVAGVSVSGANAADFVAGACAGGVALTPGAACPISVTFTPQASGNRSATLTITDTAGTHSVPLAGSGGVGPVSSISPNPIDFSAVGVAAVIPVTVTNTGDAPLLVQVAIASLYWLGGDQCSGRTIPPGASCSVEVSMATLQGSSRFGVSTNEPSTGESVAIVASSPVRDIAWTPPSHDYGFQKVGTGSAPVTYTLTVHNAAPLHLQNILITAGYLITADTCSLQLILDGGSCHVSIVFAPSGDGEDTGATTVDGMDNGNVTDPPPAIGVTGYGGGTTLQFTPSGGALVFPATEVHTPSGSQIAWITNNGSGPLDITSISIAGRNPGDFSVSDETCTGAAHYPGDSPCAIAIDFLPQATGTRQATLVVQDDAAGSPHTMLLSGSAFGSAVGYRMVAGDGGIFSFGAPFYGSMGGQPITAPIVGMATPPLRNGVSVPRYFMVGSDGNVYDFGLATATTRANLGSMYGKHLNQPIVGMAATPSGNGYWLVARDGGIFPFGDAAGYGSTGGIRLNQPIVGMAATPSGNGYWLVAADGGIFPFGDAAQGLGSTGDVHLNQPMVGMAATPSGRGYWLVAADGGIFPFGDGTQGLGSTGNIHLNQPIVGMASTASARGYWLVAADGGIFPFGDAPGLGSMGGTKLVKPVVGMTMAVSTR